MGTKVNDWLAAWGCFNCHRFVDGGYTWIDVDTCNKLIVTKDQVDLALLRGMARTQTILLERGYKIETK